MSKNKIDDLKEDGVITKEFIEDLCANYFDGRVKPKHLTSFSEVTPEGNKIEGFINRKPNRYLGSLLIMYVNGEECFQFIQSMPKINYFQHTTDIPIQDNHWINPCYEKLDGSCLILYPLKNKNDEIIEIVPKTRGRAVADNHFIELYNKIDKKPILNYYKDHDGILIFEMYGILNQHDIIHYNTGIDIRLISIYENNQYWSDKEIFFNTYGFILPDRLFNLYHEGTEWFIQATSRKYYAYLQNNKYSYPTINDCIDGLMEILENLNREFYEINKRLAVEGVVINTIREDGSKRFIKCKPKDIMIKHTTEHGIPRKAITKEVLKYFDEYGSTVKEIYNNDTNHHTEYLHRMLSEEYPEELIMKSKKKIEKIFMQIWENREVPTSIHTLCDELYNKYGDKGITHCMRMFSQEYPQKKKDARLVYGVLEKKFVKDDIQ